MSNCAPTAVAAVNLFEYPQTPGACAHLCQLLTTCLGAALSKHCVTLFFLHPSPFGISVLVHQHRPLHKLAECMQRAAPTNPLQSMCLASLMEAGGATGQLHSRHTVLVCYTSKLTYMLLLLLPLHFQQPASIICSWLLPLPVLLLQLLQHKVARGGCPGRGVCDSSHTHHHHQGGGA